MDKETKVGFTVLGVLAALIVLGLAIDSSEPTEPAADQEVPAQTKRPTRIPREDMDYLWLAYVEAKIFGGPVRCEQMALGERLYAACTRRGSEHNRLWLYEDGKFAPLNGRARQDSEHFGYPFGAMLFEMPPPLPADIDIVETLNAFNSR